MGSLFVMGREMAKSEQSSLMFVRSLLGDNVVNNADLARKIAELLLENAYGERAVSQQLPLRVEDLGDRWVILGSSECGSGVAKVIIRKLDCNILDLNIPDVIRKIPK